MTDEDFERRVRDLVKRDGILESEARLRVGLDAGLGGDVSGDPVADADPISSLEALGDSWAPLPSKPDRT